MHYARQVKRTRVVEWDPPKWRSMTIINTEKKSAVYKKRAKSRMNLPEDTCQLMNGSRDWSGFWCTCTFQSLCFPRSLILALFGNWIFGAWNSDDNGGTSPMRKNKNPKGRGSSSGSGWDIWLWVKSGARCPGCSVSCGIQGLELGCLPCRKNHEGYARAPKAERNGAFAARFGTSVNLALHSK